jgi:hypothetical protein
MGTQIQESGPSPDDGPCARVAGGDLHPDLAGRLVGAEDGGAVESEEALERAQGGPQRAVEVLRRGEDLGHLVDGRDLGLLGGSGIGHDPIIAYNAASRRVMLGAA